MLELLYGCTTWTLKKFLEKKLHAYNAEMCGCKDIVHIGSLPQFKTTLFLILVHSIGKNKKKR